VTAAPLFLSVACHAADSANATQNAAVAEIDFDYRDTSDEERDQRQEHATRLRDLMTAPRSDLKRGERSSCLRNAIPRMLGGSPGGRTDAWFIEHPLRIVCLHDRRPCRKQG